MDAYRISLLLVLFLALMSVLFRLRGQLWIWVGRGVVHVLLGLFLLFVSNLVGSHLDLYVPYNLITVGISALLGLPGVLALFCIQWLLI